MPNGLPASAKMRAEAGAPGRARTCNLRLRRPTLYPIELRAHGRSSVLAQSDRAASATKPIVAQRPRLRPTQRVAWGRSASLSVRGSSWRQGRCNEEKYSGEGKCQRVLRRHSEEERADRAGGEERRPGADDDADDRKQAALPDDERANRAGLGTKREPNAHFTLPEAHRVAQDAVDADGRKRQGEERVSRDDEQRETFLGDAAADDVCQHSRLIQDQCRIDRAELASDVARAAGRPGDRMIPLRSAPSCGWLRTAGAGDTRSTESHRAPTATSAMTPMISASPPATRNSSADRILVWIERPRQTIVDDDLPRRHAVLRRERSPAQHSDAQRIEERGPRRPVDRPIRTHPAAGLHGRHSTCDTCP